MKVLVSTRESNCVRYGREWRPIGPDGLARGSTHGIAMTPGERDDDCVIDSDDIDSIREEIRRHGYHGIQSFLEASGVAIEVARERFNRVAPNSNVVDYQYDHGGIAIGVSRRYECRALGLSWTTDTSH